MEELQFYDTLDYWDQPITHVLDYEGEHMANLQMDGDVYRVVEIHFGITADELRQIADKLDTLNGKENDD